ncbi:MAG: hypothetical protein ACYDH5_20455 [Acidimicrobiales bacterium]
MTRQACSGLGAGAPLRHRPGGRCTTTQNLVAGALGRELLLAATPYPDPRRRLRVRKAARRLVTCSPWPGDDATAEDVAQLALLRALWLDRETHRAYRHRHSESAALLAQFAGLVAGPRPEARPGEGDQR